MEYLEDLDADAGSWDLSAAPHDPNNPGGPTPPFIEAAQDIIVAANAARNDIERAHHAWLLHSLAENDPEVLTEGFVTSSGAKIEVLKPLFKYLKIRREHLPTRQNVAMALFALSRHQGSAALMSVHPDFFPCMSLLAQTPGFNVRQDTLETILRVLEASPATHLPNLARSALEFGLVDLALHCCQLAPRYLKKGPPDAGWYHRCARASVSILNILCSSAEVLNATSRNDLESTFGSGSVPGIATSILAVLEKFDAPGYDIDLLLEAIGCLKSLSTHHDQMGKLSDEREKEKEALGFMLGILMSEHVEVINKHLLLRICLAITDISGSYGLGREWLIQEGGFEALGTAFVNFCQGGGVHRINLDEVDNWGYCWHPLKGAGSTAEDVCVDGSRYVSFSAGGAVRVRAGDWHKMSTTVIPSKGPSRELIALSIVALNGAEYYQRYAEGVEEPVGMMYHMEDGISLIVAMLESSDATMIPLWELESILCFNASRAIEKLPPFEKGTEHKPSLVYTPEMIDNLKQLSALTCKALAKERMRREKVEQESPTIADDLKIESESEGMMRHGVRLLKYLSVIPPATVTMACEIGSVLWCLTEAETEDHLLEGAQLLARCAKDVIAPRWTQGSNYPRDLGVDFGRFFIVQSGGLPVLGKMIEERGVEVRLRAMEALAGISHRDELNLRVLEADLIPLLALHLATGDVSSDSELMNYAAEAFGQFLLCGGHEALPDTVAEEPSLQEVVAKALFALRKEEDLRQFIVQDGALWVLCTVANHPSVASRVLVASLLADLAEDDGLFDTPEGGHSIRVQIAKGGGMHALMALYSGSSGEVDLEVFP